MVELEVITLKEFKKEMNKEYKQLFPSSERKSYSTFNKLVKKGVCEFLRIKNDDTTVGFFILVNVNNYIQIDYFAIFERYQSSGYGSEAVKVLQKRYENCDGIFIEIEKVGMGENDVENILRKRRYNFYKRLGFIELGFDFYLFNVTYSICSYNFKEKDNIDLASNIMFDFYRACFNEKKLNKNCRIIK